MIINIKKSYILGAIMTTGYLAGAVILLSFMTTTWLMAPLALIVAAAGCAQVRQTAFLGSDNSLVAVAMKVDVLEVAFANDRDKFIKSKIQNSFVSQNLVAVKMKLSGRKSISRLLLIRGMCSDHEFRLLKKFLRLHADEKIQELVT